MIGEAGRIVRIVYTILFLIFFSLGPQAVAGEIAAPLLPVKSDTRCPVCGMFIDKYPQWLSQARLSDGTVAAFDGVKDLAAYAFSPQAFGAAPGAVVVDIAVRDYYSQAWTDGRKALYVLGSDILGPMGHELIPFSSRPAAENFMRDHHGQEILDFIAISPPLVESLRKGHKMKAHGAAGKK
jgi:copper chaperone NosL